MSETFSWTILVFMSILLLGCVQSPPMEDNIITLSEISQHASPNDCWVAMRGNVYDITSLLAQQSPDSFTFSLSEACGKDASTSFQGRSPPMGQDQNAFDSNRPFPMNPGFDENRNQNGFRPTGGMPSNSIGENDFLAPYLIGKLST